MRRLVGVDCSPDLEANFAHQVRGINAIPVWINGHLDSQYYGILSEAVLSNRQGSVVRMGRVRKGKYK